MSRFTIRLAEPADLSAAYHVCLKTGDHGRDGEPFYQDDPDALGRIFVGPYLELEPELSLVLVDELGVCGYCLAALDSQTFYQRYDQDWRPRLCREFPFPPGDPATWTRAETVHSWYHQPDYFCPQPYADYPSHIHIDLLERARGQGQGKKMMHHQMQALIKRRSPGAHLNVSIKNLPAQAFYNQLGFQELTRTGPSTAGSIYLAKTFTAQY